jgi:hypothetical protein
VGLLKPVLGEGFLGAWTAHFIGRLLERPPTRLARLLYLREEAGADARDRVRVVDWPHPRFAREAPGFAAWFGAVRARLEEEHAPLVFRAPRGARCGPSGVWPDAFVRRAARDGGV